MQCSIPPYVLSESALTVVSTHPLLLEATVLVCDYMGRGRDPFVRSRSRTFYHRSQEYDRYCDRPRSSRSPLQPDKRG